MRLSLLQLLPKVELHAHLNGCVREETLLELAKERGVSLPTAYFTAATSLQNLSQDDAGESRQQHGMYNVRPRSLEDCFAMFNEIPRCVSDLEALQRVTREVLTDFAVKDHVAYLELRSTPKVLKRSFRDDLLEGKAHSPKISKREYVETILRVMDDFETEENSRYLKQQNEHIGKLRQSEAEKLPPRLPLICRFILSIDRSRSVEEAEKTVDLAIEMSKENNRVVGVDLGGNPTRQDFRAFSECLARARDSGLHVTIHCAECSCGNDEARDSKAQLEKWTEAASILDFAPDRLGHALLLPPSLRTRLSESKIPVETCPTSNVMTLELATKERGDLVEGLRRHPGLAEWLKQRHPIAIGTDDPGVFDTSATQELMLVQKAFDVSIEVLAQVVWRSSGMAFCDEETKRQVADNMKEQIDLLLRE